MAACDWQLISGSPFAYRSLPARFMYMCVGCGWRVRGMHLTIVSAVITGASRCWLFIAFSVRV